MDERVEEFTPVEELRRNWAIPIVSILAASVGALMCKYGDSSGGEAIIGGFLVWIGAWLAPLTLLRNAFPLSRYVTLRATPSALMVDDREPIRVEDIQEARVVPRAVRKGVDVVELTLKQRGKLRLSLSTKDAARLVGVLGAGAGERRATFPLILSFASRFFASLGLVGVPLFTFSMATSNGSLAMLIRLPFFIVPMCALIAMAFGVVRGKVVIGADGFTTSWLGMRRFRSFELVRTIVRKERSGGAIVDTVVEYQPGKPPLRLIARDTPDTHNQRGAEGRALAKTMAEAHARWLRIPAATKASAQLERGQRTAKEWLAGIDQLVRGGHGNYRVAAVTPEILVDLAHEPNTNTDARIGAAAALLRLNDEAHRGTVRIAAEACAEPTTRKALLDLVEAEDDDEAIEAALARVRYVR